MKTTVALLAVVLLLGACAQPATRASKTASLPASSVTTADTSAPLSPSPRLIVGRILSVDRAQSLAFVDLQSDAPRDALSDGAELAARNYATLAPTAQLRASRYTRGRTLGTTIVSGQPAIGDEVVWLAP